MRENEEKRLIAQASLYQDFVYREELNIEDVIEVERNGIV